MAIVIGWATGTYDIVLAAAIVDGHVPAFAVVLAVGEKLVHKVGEGEASLFEHACFSILAIYDVFWCKGRG